MSIQLKGCDVMCTRCGHEEPDEKSITPDSYGVFKCSNCDAILCRRRRQSDYVVIKRQGAVAFIRRGELTGEEAAKRLEERCPI